MRGKLEKFGKMELGSPLYLTLVRMEKEKTKLGKPSSGWENNKRRVIK